MAKFSKFEDLDDEAFFVEMVTDHFTKSNWADVFEPVSITPVIDPAKIKSAFSLYQNNLARLRILVPSQDPNHLKRGACLLDALNRAEILVDLECEDGNLASALEQGDPLGLSWNDCQHAYGFVKYIHQNGNQVLAVDLVFRCCQVYEPEQKTYTKDYLDHLVHYLAVQGGDVASLYLLLRTFWEN